MPIGYDFTTGGLAFISDECPDCGDTMYGTGCDAPGCDNFTCPSCGYGCNWESAGEDGTCGQAADEETQEEYDGRINAERAVFGLGPVGGAR